MKIKQLTGLIFSFCLPWTSLCTPALAEGELTVEYQNGDVVVFSDVQISDTEEIIYFQGQENDSILMITKNECREEGEILVCNQARVGLQSYGVLEELPVEQIFLFINPTDENQGINGSTVIMSPNTILLEFATEQGSFVTGFGTIDSTVRPQEAIR